MSRRDLCNRTDFRIFEALGVLARDADHRFMFMGAVGPYGLVDFLGPLVAEIGAAQRAEQGNGSRRRC